MSSILKVSEIQDPTNGNTALQVASDGVISRGKIPHLKVGMDTATTVNTGDRILYNSFSGSYVFAGEDNMSGFSTSNNTYTIPTNCSGLWHISASVYGTTSNPNQIGVSINNTREDAIGSDSGQSSMCQGAIVRRLTAGDVIRLLVFSAGSTTTPQPNKYHTWWEMTFLG